MRALAVLLVAEVSVRKDMGDVYAGERITHAVMGILYGGMLAFLIPVLLSWLSSPTALATASPDVSESLRRRLTMMAGGVFLSGVRDLYAALGLPYGNWPWPKGAPARDEAR